MELLKLSNDITANYGKMLSIIAEKMPALEKTKASFCKSQSQFMDNNLTVTQLSPIRSLRQISAECEKIESALRETYFKREKQKIEIAAKKHVLAVQSVDEFAKRMFMVEIAELESLLLHSEKYINSSIRQLTAYLDQYDSIAEKFGIKDFTERDFEEQEEEYHIKTAFSQAITAARARNGLIDEGNHIYFMHLGISGYQAQVEINRLFTEESKTNENTFGIIIKFLDEMATKFKGCSLDEITRKGMKKISEIALLEQLPKE